MYNNIIDEGEARGGRGGRNGRDELDRDEGFEVKEGRKVVSG